MRRTLGLLITAVGLLLAAPSVRAQKEPENFTFFAIADTRQTASGEYDTLRKFAQDAAQMSPKPAFIIDSGDITASGRAEEYARFKAATSGLEDAGIGFFAVPGSRDVCWSPDGKEGFVKAFGKLYQSFDRGGAHFVLLDSTVALESWGHFDKVELDWLRNDVKRVKVGTPVFLFLHHTLGRDIPSTRLIDNEFELVPILRGQNVVAIFTGGKEDLAWKVNGATTVAAQGLSEGSYYKVSVTPLVATIDRVGKAHPDSPDHIATLPLAQKAKPSILRAFWDDPNIPFLARRRPSATLEPRAVTDNPDKERAEYRLDDGPWSPLAKDARDIWKTQFPTKPISVGVHTAGIRLTTSNYVALEDELILEVEHDTDEPTQKWAINLDGPIQSSPFLANNLLVVSSLDGRVYALELEKGRHRWAFGTKGQFLASPVLDGATIYIGGTDHFLYALDAANGRQRWKFDTGSPVFASAAIAQGTVCIGGNGKIFGLDAATGTLKWTQPTGGFFQSRAATDGQSFFLGGWDNTLYALDAQTGTPRWKAPMGHSFAESPAVASPSVGAGRVYAASNDGVLHAVNIASGKEEWTLSAPSGGDVFGLSSPVFDNGVLYLAGQGEKGSVYAVSVADKRIVWQAATGQTMYDSSVRVAPDGKSLAVMGFRGRVSVLDTSNGQRLWGYELGPGNVFSAPEYDGQIVYTVTMANDVQAINGPGVGSKPRPKITHQ